jgi:hypothetical protein
MAVLLASSGLDRLRNEIAALPRSPENPDPQFVVGSGDPNKPDFSAYVSAAYSHVLALSAPGGLGHSLLDQLWIVYVFETWEEDVRARLAAARGVSRNDVRASYFGDLRHLRNDVVHHAGIATRRNTGKCELIGDWFAIGDPIRLTGAQIRTLIYDLFPEAELLPSAR